ncbi:MAG: c-type cytochrome [Elusimicrobia bacterium]|nr:c-type cytochrome [Elusimicrobiota bacterium]
MEAKKWHREYLERYQRLKEAGLPFFPNTVFKDTLVAFVIFALLAYLAWTKGAVLEEPADPTDNTYNPRPEWYFLFLFQALKLFPGHLEAVAAVVLPGMIVLGFILVPFLDRGPRRHPLTRPLGLGLGVVGLGVYCFLTWKGYSSPLTNPIVEKDPVILAGRRLYRDLKCSYCHKVSGKGGTAGPELDKVAGEETEAWLISHFKNPQQMSPGSTMPVLNLLDDEITSLVAYMKSFGVGSYTPEAPKLFAENCSACHMINKQGGDSGPDLSLIGSARDKNFLKKYVEDPSQMNPSSAMPGFQGQLTDTQIDDIARYLATLGQ